MVYTSLTEAPHNLKEAIDWLMAVKGTDGENNLKALGKAVYDVLADKPIGKAELPALEKVKPIAKKFLEHKDLKGQWFVRMLMDRYNRPLNRFTNRVVKSMIYITDSDYKDAIKGQRLTAGNIGKKIGEVVDGCGKLLDGVKNHDKYKSAYSSEATWDASCSKDPEACAVVLVGIAPVLFVGLRSLFDAVPGRIFGVARPKAKGNSEKILTAVGYELPQRRSEILGAELLNALEGVSTEVLTTIYDLAGFWAFY
ncbi:hypothetical protein BBBOND_0310470 [Babesia bigemina]|uniref:Uncharacterized protein n=1 Tax=Babesia bigemina TaxID=5866 RepID=A0A061DD67_BABBI|nr:hypothetical protein BBBOND_0310470 [Babesia bigemina]CDR97144.1 hypothetical protein BBBOND_0310470 [Babesia bigemina]|eukprot:XP_012769330.1 hypothetical protein BBBOND_0310470 [Babesia bigemina]